MPARRELKDHYMLAEVMVGACPHCRPPPHRLFEDSVIYRFSTRSVTMRCRTCSLQWTVTHHRIAETARRMAERADEPRVRNLYRRIAKAFKVDETRGKRRS